MLQIYKNLATNYKIIYNKYKHITITKVTKIPSKGLGRLKLYMRFGLNKIKFLQLVYTVSRCNTLAYCTAG